VVTLTSSSLAFYRTGTTRVIPYCHTANSLLVIVGFCSSSTPAVSNITTDPNNLVSQILVSFLTGTKAWQSVGQAAESNSVLAATAGVNLQLRDKNDFAVQLIGGSVTSVTPSVNLAANSASGNLYAESVAAGSAQTVQLTPLSGTAQTASITLPPATSLPAVVKPGPMISPKGVIPAAGPAPFPYDVAPGAYVSIYGSNLASATSVATIPYPMQIGDVQVLVNGTAAQIVFVSAGQINFVYPNAAVGLTQLTVKNANGQNSANVRVAPAVPSIFLLDANATAAARNALTSVVVGPSAPLRAGDYLSLYLTGLGATTVQNGLDVAAVQPTIAIGGQNVPVAYAGRSPGFAGLDQINCQIPAGIGGDAVPVVVTSNGRASNTAYIAIMKTN